MPTDAEELRLALSIEAIRFHAGLAAARLALLLARAVQDAGGRLVGTTEAVKSAASIGLKLRSRHPGSETAAAAFSLEDAFRWTAVFPGSSLVSGFRQVIGALDNPDVQATGKDIRLLTVHDYWDPPDNRFRGILCYFVDRQMELIFELAVHTDESFDAAKLSHREYEYFRTLAPDDPSRGPMAAEMGHAVAGLIAPTGRDEIPHRVSMTTGSDNIEVGEVIRRQLSLGGPGSWILYDIGLASHLLNARGGPTNVPTLAGLTVDTLVRLSGLIQSFRVSVGDIVRSSHRDRLTAAVVERLWDQPWSASKQEMNAFVGAIHRAVMVQILEAAQPLRWLGDPPWDTYNFTWGSRGWKSAFHAGRDWVPITFLLQDGRAVSRIVESHVNNRLAEVRERVPAYPPDAVDPRTVARMAHRAPSSWRFGDLWNTSEVEALSQLVGLSTGRSGRQMEA